MDSYHHLLPKLGQTRCYWALLSTDLQFIYLDPVLAYHLEAEAESLIGHSLLSFVHPDEQASAKTDLRSVLESRTLHGSVTRVRFSRLSKIRRQLGHTGPPQTWSEEDKLAVDANYMAVDIVINWAAEGLVLCFIHATVDLDPQSDNDELNKSHWTNWCGTPYMPPEQIQLLFQRLLMRVPQQSPSNTHTRIFQILANQPRRQLLLSWPPDQGNGYTGRDFAKLVENAELAAGPQKGNDAKTSCTRRYRATQLMSPSLGEVESIFIPHGSVIFACHKVESSMRSTSTNPTPMEHQLAYDVDNSPNYPPSSAPPYYDSSTPYSLNPTYNQGYLAHQSIPISRSPSAYHSSRWPQTHQNQNYSTTQPLPTQQQWTSSPTHAITPLPPLPPHTHTSQAMSNNNHRPGIYSNTLTTGPPWQAPPGGYEVYRAPSPGYGFYSSNVPRSTGGGNVGAGTLSTATPLTGANVTQDVVPPPKRRISPGSVKGGDQNNPATSSGRGTGNRPSGILECSSCGATASPEWRKGPSGKKELCNACGLRYARSRAKKDGGAGGPGQGRKKKAEKVDVREKAGHSHVVGGNGSSNGANYKRDIRTKHRGSPGGRMTPPLATIAAAAGSPGYASTIMRRSFGSGSEYGTPGTPPSASGSESGQLGRVHYTAFAAGATGEAEAQNGNTLTPSPSPPAPASISVPPTSASGSLGLSTSGASTSSVLSAASASTLTSTSALPQMESTQDNNFIHYHPPHPPSQQHDRGIPSLSVHPHSYSHSQLHSPQGSQSHPPHFLPAGSVSSTGHYVHTYTARPSPLSQANNIVTGPAAGPLTPLSVPHSATEGADGTDLSNGTQLPPLAYMDRLVGSNLSSGPNNANNAPSLGEVGGVKTEFGDKQVQGNGGGRNTEVGGGGTNVGREPLTPLSAESPIGPGVGGRHGRRMVLGGQ